MKPILLIILLQLTGYQTLFAQDSLYIRPFLDKKEYPNIDSIPYEIIRSGRKIIGEGWTIYEHNPSESKIMSIKNTLKESQISHKIGVWTFYRKNGSIEGIDTILFENGKHFGSQSYYDKSGNLRGRVLATQKKEIYARGIMTEQKIENEANQEWIQYEYSKEGVLTRKRIWIEKKKTFDEKY